MANRTLFDIFGPDAPPSPLDAFYAEQDRLKQEQAAKEYQVVPPKAETKSFSFSPDNQQPQPTPDSKGDLQLEKTTVPDSISTNSISSDSNQKADYNEDSAHIPTSKNDFSSLIQDAENISSVALALEEMLTKDSVRWSGTAHILSELLQKHIEKLKNLAL